MTAASILEALEDAQRAYDATGVLAYLSEVYELQEAYELAVAYENARESEVS